MGAGMNLPAAPISDTALESELFFECCWFEKAAEDLNVFVQTQIPIQMDPVMHNILAWSYVDRMLVHATRISRLVEPGSAPDSRESKTSFKERVRFAEEFRKRINLKTLKTEELRRCRNAVEHSNERLVDYILEHKGGRTGPFSVRWGEATVADAGVKAYRQFNHSTGEVLVFGRRANLLEAYAAVVLIKQVIHSHADSEVH